ncbi:MAG: oligopeptide transporter, OPT family [Gammaproteobacteria bacterium]|nr:oligopeptide transporter, OPT family [Gammaproteobacteria bacterium]
MPTLSSRELTFRAVLLGMVLAVLLAASNTYLALKIGILTSASIPAAVLSMGILRFFKRVSILENNLVQTAASAGEAIAGGIVYTIPGLILIHYWQGFDYWENFFIALIGGSLGILFSIPIRRTLVHDESLRFPEGRAIAQVLQMTSQEKSQHFKYMVQGGVLGAIIEFLQSGLHVVSASAQSWFRVKQVVLGGGLGFSATLVGAGFLMGIRLGSSLLIGAVVAWIIGVPILSFQQGDIHSSAAQVVATLRNEKIAYLGIGAMLTGGVWALVCFIKPFYISLAGTFAEFSRRTVRRSTLPRTERDIPFSYIVLGLLLCFVGLYFLFQHLCQLSLMVPSALQQNIFLMIILAYLLLLGFAASTICGYFSGMVGVTASPGSAVAIASVLLSALLVRMMLGFVPASNLLPALWLKEASAIVIIMTCVIMGGAAIANDNIQDLKVGYLIKATPWKQQLMLFLGVLMASATVPVVMQLLFSVYGIGDVLPRAGMNPAQALAAPPAMIMATLAQSVFNHQLPFVYFGVGALVVFFFILFQKRFNLSALGIGIGMYLPLSTSTPLILGSFFSYLHDRARKKSGIQTQSGTLKACGIVAGAALMDVLIAIPLALNPDVTMFTLFPSSWEIMSVFLGFVVLFILGKWLNSR